MTTISDQQDAQDTQSFDLTPHEQEAITLLRGMNVPWPKLVGILKRAAKEGSFAGSILRYEEGKAVVGTMETAATNVPAGSSPPATRY